MMKKYLKEREMLFREIIQEFYIQVHLEGYKEKCSYSV